MLKPRHRAVLDALLPGLGPDFDAFLAEFRTEAPLPMRLAFRAALEAGAWIAPLLIGRGPTLARLPPAERERALEALGKSGAYLLRQQLLVLKTVVALHHGARPDVRASLGMTS